VLVLRIQPPNTRLPIPGVKKLLSIKGYVGEPPQGSKWRAKPRFLGLARTFANVIVERPAAEEES
jgi:hypothetical protein